MKPEILPNALIRAFAQHFIYEKDTRSRLYNIPIFIEKSIKEMEYKNIYVFKRFTGRLLGYLIKTSETDFVIFIPCAREERNEIQFLINNCMANEEFIDKNYSLKTVFIGPDSLEGTS